MKILFFLLFPFLVFSYELNLEINNLQNANSKLYIGLFKNQQSFDLEKNSYKSAIVKINHNKTKYTFKDLPKGIYAISIFQDLNLNGILDKNFLGAPNEPYGFSNNPQISFRKPTFKESKFQIDKTKTILINMDQ